MHELIQYIDAFKSAKIAVFGDVMLDEFIYGEVNRISPEAPIPIFEEQYINSKLGGSGNVASNIADLGGRVDLYAVIGPDSLGSELASLLKGKKIGNYLITDKNRPTTKKTRHIAQGYQIGLRSDKEKKEPISPEIASEVIRLTKRNMNQYNAIIFSDYAKGFLTGDLCKEIITMAKEYKVPVIVDPKAIFSKYAGADVITPNHKEMQSYGNVMDNDPETMFNGAKKLISSNGLQRILVTRGEKGMTIFSSNDYKHINAVNDGLDVIDITGAGDTAIAVFSMALAVEASYEQAMHLANFASGVVVSKQGTATCEPKELEFIIRTKGLK
jgi:rfaE bifunctional protein kinase chain/domain